MTHWTGKRTSSRLRSEATSTCSRWSSSDGPWYQAMFAERSTTLSPWSALTGMKVTSSKSRPAANAMNSSRIDS